MMILQNRPTIKSILEDRRVKGNRTRVEGGLDFLLEIVSPGDICRDKLTFYASIGDKEVLILDRDPWKLELYQLKCGRLRLPDVAHSGPAKAIASGVVPLTFQLVRSKPRPKIRIRNMETDQEWKN